MKKYIMTVNFEDGTSETVIGGTSESGKNCTFVSYAGASFEACVETECTRGTKTHSQISRINLSAKKPLAPMKSVILPHFISGDKFCASYHDKLWWMYPQFTEKSAGITGGTQNLLFFKENAKQSYGSAVMLCGDKFYTEIEGENLCLSIGVGGISALSGPLFAMSKCGDPYKAVKFSYEFAKSQGAIIAPLLKDKKYCDFMNYFGYCTWNTFYQAVSAEKIYAKLSEFKKKKVRLKWMIIDDGWSKTKDNKLTGFEADETKFPEGLKACISRIKKEFGVEKVGVWHAFDAYWDGVDPESELFAKYSDCLTRTSFGRYVPSTDPAKAFKFWDAWHSYLEDCGVDFLKVDNQSSIVTEMTGTFPIVEAARNAHEAIEKSIDKHFGGRVINCMGMDMVNVQNRPHSYMTRNSDDFFPNIPNGFAKHVIQNAYSAIWHSQLYFCDYDMWWSGKASPRQSADLRTISGGPIYVSDALGETDAEMIHSTCSRSGRFKRNTMAAVPTPDLLFVDVIKEKRLMKLMSKRGKTVMLAIFNISEDTEISETVTIDSTIVGIRQGTNAAIPVSLGPCSSKLLKLSENGEIIG